MNAPPFIKKTARWNPGKPYQKGSFTPAGRLHYSDREATRRYNPVGWDSGPVKWAARIFVGFNVGKRPVWSMEHVVALTRDIRRKQGMKEDSSFVYQKGVYEHEDPKHGVVQEESAQIVFLNLYESTETPLYFCTHMLLLAEELRLRLQQESVILEFVVDGIPHRTIGLVDGGKGTVPIIDTGTYDPLYDEEGALIARNQIRERLGFWEK